MSPQQIGPYRLERSLGRGGMGEVFRAFDTRLERWVAIKVIRVDRVESSVIRERFRREARAAAALTHPSIVQIHDVQSHEGADSIVMELVEGATLAHRFAAGRLAPFEVASIGRQVAEGLAAAHDLGIVHRDLKADNVMVTSSGQAKILDFGLAKRVAYSKEQSLTEDGGVIGTWHSMAPEQARGLEIDHRADLFSLGVLLYQAGTGERPFQGTTPVETLTKVCVEPHRPAELIEPSLPPSLCRLVDRLLHKDPALRPSSANEVVRELAALERTLGDDSDPSSTDLLSTVGSNEGVRRLLADDSAVTWPLAQPAPTAEPSPRRRGRWVGLALVGLALVALALVGFVVWWQGRPNPSADPHYVAVLAPRLGAIESVHEDTVLASALRVALERGVVAEVGLVAVPPDQVDAVSGDSVAVGQAVAADEVVTSELSCRRDRCQATLHRVDVGSGGLLSSTTIQVPGDDLLELSSLVARAVRTNPAWRSRGERELELDVRPEDYDAFLRLRRSFRERQEDTSRGAILDALAAIETTSPRFIEAPLLEAEVARFRFQETRDREDLDRARAAADRARVLAPDDPRPWLSLAKIARLGDQLDDWDDALRAVESMGVSDASVDVQQALLLERRGRGDEALKEMTLAVARHPAWFNRFELANLQYRLGKIDAAREQLNVVLLTQPDHFATQSFLAQLELLNGSPERAAELYEGLVAQSTGITELSNLGLAYLLLDRFGDASGCFEQVVADSPESPFALLNLADALVLEGRADAARDVYQQVDALVAADPAASSWQMLTVRAQALAHLGSAQPAAALAQEALVIAGDNPQATYEAALVYALVGDRFSALVNAERAVALGTDARWFAFPWFDALREEPSFAALVADRPKASRP